MTPPLVHPPITVRSSPLVYGAALAGYLAFGAAAQVIAPTATSPFLLAAPLVGGVAFTAPSLIVLHQWLALPRTPGEVAGTLLHALARGGILALSLAPLLLFFASSGHAGVTRGLTFLSVFGVVGVVLHSTVLDLIGDETAAAGSRSVAVVHLLAQGWALLCALVTGVLWSGVA